MAKTWNADDPKAGLMARKRSLIVEAAEAAFLEAGYAEASVNRIAAAAGVSIKTLYRHYESKAELFSAVMEATCGRSRSDDSKAATPSWYALPPAEALPAAGAEHLGHLLSAEQIALYRVVVRDAHRFPDLGQRYLEATTVERDRVFVAYLDRWSAREGWTIRDPRVAAASFVALLKAGLWEEVLCGERSPSDEDIGVQAHLAGRRMLALLSAGEL